MLYNVSYRFKTYSALILCRFVLYVLLNRNVYGKKKTPCKITGGSCSQKDLFCSQKYRLCSHYMSFCFFCLWFFVFKKTIFTAYFIKAKANFIGSVKRKAVHSPALYPLNIPCILCPLHFYYMPDIVVILPAQVDAKLCFKIFKYSISLKYPACIDNYLCLLVFG